ncbi:MAG: hypothetical protein M0Q87_08785 [Ottowia sp.]|nr:hypothetical protein [Ottowia sp.]
MMNGISMNGAAVWFGAQGWFMLLIAVVVVLPFWKIFSKAGFPGWLSLLMLVPLVNLITLYVIAFSRWPARRDPELLK